MSESQIDLIALLGRFGREQRISLRDPKAIESFLSSAEASIVAGLENDALLHGQRTQNMFEALVISLGDYKLLKVEDTGAVYPEGVYIAPHFRLVLKDGRQWLVEVKNSYNADPSRQRLRLRTKDVAKLRVYADTMGLPLKFAVYWAAWRVWTLVDSNDLELDGTKSCINMEVALVLSELAEIGDLTIGTEPPLKFRLLADHTKMRSVNHAGEVSFTVADAKMFSHDREIRDPTERSMAWIFMNYSDWVCGEPHAIYSGDMLEGVEFEWLPKDRLNPGQRFDFSAV